MRIAVPCQECFEPVAVDVPEGGPVPASFACAACGKTSPLSPEPPVVGGKLVRCALCGHEDFFRQRDFPRAVGCNVVLLAAILAFWTYGLSLVVASIVELLIYRFVREMAVCYRCRSEYRGVSVPESARPFDHHLRDEMEGDYDLSTRPEVEEHP